ncbi:DUF6461 domain-containing protein [Nonomuraea sp. NPDC049684]|uniref:DUF6461 domain-containing protein n=1 Tax=Nonomuraea sp. NPDC049684 TaxID=3364356 RepID=UPI0037B3DBEB
MDGATSADYAWLSDRWTDGLGTTVLCITFVRDLAPADALRRIKVTPGTRGAYDVAAYAARAEPSSPTPDGPPSTSATWPSRCPWVRRRPRCSPMSRTRTSPTR